MRTVAPAGAVKLYVWRYDSLKTYLAAALFVVGNIVLPQLCHLMPDGGRIWLPIYFFTLVGAYKYGWRVGLLTAMASPIVNSLCFGMPAAAALPAILLKSVLLAMAAGWMAQHFGRVRLWILAAVVLAYQTLGSLGEWAMGDTFAQAMQDFRLGLPGMLVQVAGGYLVIRFLLKK